MSEFGARCTGGTVKVVAVDQFGNQTNLGCHSIPSNYENQIDTSAKYPVLRGDFADLMPMFYGPLGEGEYYETGDLNNDGLNELYKATTTITNGVATENVITVYGFDNKGNKTETSYDDWLDQYGQDEGPDLSELISEYGEDVVNDLQNKYDELVDFIGNVPEDPVGSIKKMAEIFIEGATGIDPQCSGSAGPGTETELETWILDCVSIGVLIDIGIPGLPGLGGIFKNTTIRDIKEAAEKVGSTFEDFINGNPTCGEDDKQECTPAQILEDLGNWVIDSVGDIFDGVDDLDAEKILGTLGGIFGPILSGIIYEEFKDLINSEIEDVIGIPVIPFAPLQECEKKGQTTVETSEGSGQFQCGPCKQEGFTPTGPNGECVDPNVVAGQPCDGPYNSTGEIDEQGNCNFVQGASCQPPNEPTGTDGEIDASGNCIALGGDDDDDVTLTDEEELCRKTGRKYDDLNDECLQECDNSEYIILADGNCGPDPDGTPSTECPAGKVRRGGLDDGECVTPGVVCFSEPSKYPGDQLNIAQGQFNSEGFCVDPNIGQGSCPSGNEPDYFPEDTDQDGAFFYDGETITYDPCDPLGKDNSMIFNAAPELVCNDPNTKPPEGDDGGCGDCKDNFRFDLEQQKCVPSGDNNGGQNQGDDCDLGNNEVGVVDANNNCVKVGSWCLRSAFGQEYCPKTGYNTPYGKINADGDCECPSNESGETCKDENRKQNPDGSCADECKDNFEFDNSDINSPTFGECVPIQQGPNRCDDPNAQNNGEVGECVCNAGFDKPQGYDFCTSIEQLCADGAQGYGPDNELCGTANGCPEGQSKFDGVNCEEACADDPTIGVSDPFCGSTPKTCNDPNAVNDGEEGDCRCKPGFVKGDDGLCFQSDNVCENGATVESGCDTCPDGTNVAEYPDGQCPAQDCSDPAYAAANPTECGTTPECNDCSCAEYAAANPEECASAPPPETGGGGGGGGGGAGAFSPFIAGIDYTPQPLPTAPATPQKDYMMELDNLIKRSLFEGIV